MNPLTSNKILAGLFSLLFIYLSIDFIQDRDEVLGQFHYRWEEKETVQDLGAITIDSIGSDYLDISGFDKQINHKSNGKLELTTKNQSFYFNFEQAYVKKSSQVKFTGGHWLTVMPPGNLKSAQLKLIEVPLKQKGKKSITVISDAHLLWRGGRNFRKDLAQKNKNLYFKGNKSDLYGYPYVGEFNNTVTATLANVESIPETDIYLIFLGTQDTENATAFFDRYKALLQHLKAKNKAATIFLVELPPSTNEQRDKRNQLLNKKIDQLAGKNVNIIDFYKTLSNKPKNWISNDQIHYKKKAYDLLIKNLNKQLNAGS